MHRLSPFRGHLGVMALWLAHAGCGAVRSSADNPLTVGGLTPKIEDKDAGLVAVAPGLDLKKYKVVVVEKFPVSSAQIEDEGDRRFAEKVTTGLHQQLVRRLRESGLFQEVVDASATEVRSSDVPALRLRGEITRLGRGSQAARYFAGIYGAGRARAQADMYFDEIPSGQVVIATSDRRVSGGVQWFGGDDEEILTQSFDDMARDLAKFLVRLSKGEAPSKLP
jgi:hypothetical protein